MKRAVLLAFVVLMAGKIAVASGLDLFGDEAFYWQCAQRPDISYIDHPPLTAFLVLAGTRLFGNNPFGVRFFFLLCGALFPFAVYFLTRPLSGKRNAWLAAGATLLFPGTAHLGLVAIPDVPMLVFAVLSLLGLERATRKASVGSWVFAGICCALGIFTHYRFMLLLVAACLYLILTREGRCRLGGLGPWVWGGLTCFGFLPALLNNLRTDFEPVRYYLAGRHGVAFRFEELFKFLMEQLIVMTPLFLIALVCVLIWLWRRALRGEGRSRFFVFFAATPLIVFLVASPFEKSTLVTVHWPVPGYVVLLFFLPQVLRDFVRARPTALRKAFAVLVPGLGGVLVILLLIELGTGAVHLVPVRAQFIGWRDVAEKAREEYIPELCAQERQRCILLADNYVLGATLDFFLHSQAELYTLDHPKHRNHGRATQYRLWGRGEEGLRTNPGEDALVIVESSRIGARNLEKWLKYVRSFFERLEPLGEFLLERPTMPGKSRKFRVFRFYRGRGILAEKEFRMSK